MSLSLLLVLMEPCLEEFNAGSSTRMTCPLRSPMGLMSKHPFDRPLESSFFLFPPQHFPRQDTDADMTSPFIPDHAITATWALERGGGQNSRGREQRPGHASLSTCAKHSSLSTFAPGSRWGGGQNSRRDLEETNVFSVSTQHKTRAR